MDHVQLFLLMLFALIMLGLVISACRDFVLSRTPDEALIAELKRRRVAARLSEEAEAEVDKEVAAL